MKRAGYKVGALGLAALAAVWVSGQTKGQPTENNVFREVGGDLVIWSPDGKLSFEFETIADSGLNFDGSGNPIYMRSPSRGLEAATKTINAFFKEQSDGALGFSNATMVGGVDFSLKKAASTTQVKTERAVLADGANAATLTLPVSATLIQNDGNGGFNSRFGSGVVTLAPLKSKGNDSFRKAVLKGGTTTDFTQNAQGSASSGKLVSDSVDITKEAAATFKAIFDSRFTLDGESRQNNRTQNLDLSANQGDVIYVTGLAAGTSSPETGRAEATILKAVKSLTATGSVKFRMVAVAPRARRDTDPEGTGEIMQRTVTDATGDKMTYDSATMTLVLTGNVRYLRTTQDVGSDKEPVGIEQRMSTLTVVFDIYGEVKSAKGGSGSLRSVGGIPPR